MLEIKESYCKLVIIMIKHITDYYSILDDIQRLTNENKKLSALLQHLITQETNEKESSFIPMLKCKC